MKKLISAALALALVQSLGVSAFATITVDGETAESPYTVEGDAKYVSANAGSDMLTVEGSVINQKNAPCPAVDASGSSTIRVEGKVDEAYINQSNESPDAVRASHATVEVGGKIYESYRGSAIYATWSSKVTACDNIIEGGPGHGVYASGSMVRVDGNVVEQGPGDAVSAVDGSVVTVSGNVTQIADDDKFGSAVYAAGTSTVTVGGNVEGPTSVNSAAEVIVEGSVEDIVKLDGQLYVGRAAGETPSGAEANLHYLIGLADGSAPFDKIIITGAVSSEDDTVEGVDEKVYRYTSTSALDGKTIVFTPKAASSEFRIEGLPAGVDSVTDQGVITLTFNGAFKGGLQNLNFILVAVPGSSEPVFYLIPARSVTVIDIALPEGVNASAVRELDSADHAGITVAASLAGDGFAAVLKDGEELDAKDFSIYTHKDGSVDIIISNTYFEALGAGCYDFTARIGALEIGFTVLVADA